MRRSDARILTTHAGSLPRPPELVALQLRAARGEAIDAATLAQTAARAVRRALGRQLECGIDVGNDGEQPRESFITYVRARMSGFAGAGRRPPVADLVRFPSYRRLAEARPQQSLLGAPPRAVNEVRYVDAAPLARELADFASAQAEQGARFAETFWTAPSPGIVACAMQNAHYATLGEYVEALAQALAHEYRAIVAAGHVLQIDAPDLAMERHRQFADRPLGEFLDFARLTIAAINRALDGISPERVRLHVCWGNYQGPHVFDVPLEELLPALAEARVGALVLSMANPRHAHEHRVLARTRLPENWLLCAGVIDTTTNYVEHPEVVAERIESAAHALGDARRVLACTDCGFDTSTGFGMVAEELVWEKLKALRAGADLASARLL